VPRWARGLPSALPAIRNLIILLHIFRKDSGSVPRAEIKIANERWATLVLGGQVTVPHTEPSSAGLLSSRIWPGSSSSIGPHSDSLSRSLLSE
jgi:hypothetical protein